MNTPENTVLLAYLMHDDTLLDKAAKGARKYKLFDNKQDPAIDFLWQAQCDLYLAHKAKPSQVAVEAEIQIRLKALHAPQPFVDRVWALLNYLASRSQGLNRDMGHSLLERAMSEAAKVSWEHRLNTTMQSSMSAMRVFAAGIAEDVSFITGRESRRDIITKPLMTPEKFMVRKARRPWGVKVLDMINGGFCAGEAYGILAPTGGGKTVLACQLAFERALRKEHTTLFLYEQPVEGDIMERFMTLSTGVTIDNYRDKDWSEVPEERKARFSEAMTDISPYLTVVDFSQGSAGTAGADDVISALEEITKMGYPAKFIQLDWIGAMVRRVLGVRGIPDEPGNYGPVYTSEVDKIMQYARSKGMCGLFYHQLNTNANDRSPKVKPTAAEAMFIRSYAYYLDGCFCLGRMDETSQVCWLTTDKLRRGLRQSSLIRLAGGTMRFVEASGYTVDHRGSFVDRTQALPDADTVLKERESELRRIYTGGSDA